MKRNKQVKVNLAELLRGAEEELTDFQRDREQLKALEVKYQGEYVAAEQAWNAERAVKRMEEMQRVKSLLETVRTSLQEQQHEIAKAEAYVARLREQVRQQDVLEEVSEDAQALARLQAEHTEAVRKLQETVWQESLRLAGLREEWRRKHVEAWGKVHSLSTNRMEAIRLVESSDTDLDALRTAAPAVGEALAPYQKGYFMPVPEAHEQRGTADGVVSLVMRQEVARYEAQRRAEESASAQRRRANAKAMSELFSAPPVPLPSEEEPEEEEGRPIVYASQTMTQREAGEEE